MAGALFLAVVGGIVSTGVLFHTGHPFWGISVAIAACAAVKWLWTFWTD